MVQVQALAQAQAQAKMKQRQDTIRSDPSTANQVESEALTPAERKEQKRQQAEQRKQLSPLKKAIAKQINFLISLYIDLKLEPLPETKATIFIDLFF